MGRWGEEQDLDYIRDLPDPQSLGNRHYPPRHEEPIEVFQMVAEAKNLKAINLVHRLSDDKQRCLTTFDLTEIGTSFNRFKEEEHTMSGVIGSSQDQSFSTFMGFGPNVFACTNLSIYAQHMIRHKNTINGLRDIRNMVWDGIEELDTARKQISSTFTKMKSCPMSDEQAAWWTVNAVRQEAINSRDIIKIMDKWDKPDHSEFKPRNFYSLYNAVTGLYQERNPFNIMKLSRGLNKSSDAYIATRESKGEIVDVIA